MLFHSTLARVGVVCMAAVCVYAWMRGRRPERRTALALAIAWIASEALEDFNGHHAAQPMVFGVDLLYGGFLFVLMVRSGRQWLVWAFTYQSLVVLTHLAAILDPYADRWTFFTAYLVWSYLQLAALAVGTTLEARGPQIWAGDLARRRTHMRRRLRDDPSRAPSPVRGAGPSRLSATR